MRRVWFWRDLPLVLSLVVCVLFGAIGSEFVQGSLPVRLATNKYKTFDWSDILANLFGSGLGLYGATKIDKWYRARRELESLYAPLDLENYDDEDPEHITQPLSDRNVWDDRVEADGNDNARGTDLFRLDDDS